MKDVEVFEMKPLKNNCVKQIRHALIREKMFRCKHAYYPQGFL